MGDVISVTTLNPVASLTSARILSPSSSSPWKEYGDERGLNAPPLNMVAPYFFTSLAMVMACSRLSTAQGPATMAMRSPPTSTLPILIMESSFFICRLTSLYAVDMGTISTTPSWAMKNSFVKLFLPIIPIIFCPPPPGSCTMHPFSARTLFSWLFSTWVIPFSNMSIMIFSPCSILLYNFTIQFHYTISPCIFTIQLNSNHTIFQTKKALKAVLPGL